MHQSILDAPIEKKEAYFRCQFFKKNKNKKIKEKKFRVGPFNIPEGRVRVLGYITGARVLAEVLERSAQPI